MQHSSNRVLIYSHDTFGLGHLRRSAAIAKELVANHKDLSVLIISGSPVLEQFSFDQQIKVVSIPCIKKLSSGRYTSHNKRIPLDATLKRRTEIIYETACTFKPNLFIVDKEPLGLGGEIKSTLRELNSANIPCVLGLRDVLDDPEKLKWEWKQKNAAIALEHLYSEIWIYGIPEIYEPLSRLDLPKTIHKKIVYTGYLRRTASATAECMPNFDKIKKSIGKDFILVTPGGGGDGANFVDTIMGAYEMDDSIPYPALVILGPLMPRKQQRAFARRSQNIARVTTLTFDKRMENIMNEAVGVVAMGGYNTFCEILSFDKPALVLPRTAPRREQFIRAERAHQLGLISMVDIETTAQPGSMATALKHLPRQPVPSTQIIPGLLDGHTKLNYQAEKLLETTCPARNSSSLMNASG